MITATPLRGLLLSSRCRDAATLRGCHAAGVSSRLCDAATLTRRTCTVFATLRRCHVAGVSSHLRVFATLPRRCMGGCSRLHVVFASSRRGDAATLRRPWGGLLGSSRCRDAATLRCCGGDCSRLRLFASSCLRNEILEPALHAQWKLGHSEPHL